MNKKTKKNLKIAMLTTIVMLIILNFNSCGTTSSMRCKKYVGFEKEQCLQSYKNYVNQSDYLDFRGGRRKERLIR